MISLCDARFARHAFFFFIVVEGRLTSNKTLPRVSTATESGKVAIPSLSFALARFRRGGELTPALLSLSFSLLVALRGAPSAAAPATPSSPASCSPELLPALLPPLVSLTSLPLVPKPKNAVKLAPCRLIPLSIALGRNGMLPTPLPVLLLRIADDVAGNG